MRAIGVRQAVFPPARVEVAAGRGEVRSLADTVLMDVNPVRAGRESRDVHLDPHHAFGQARKRRAAESRPFRIRDVCDRPGGLREEWLRAKGKPGGPGRQGQRNQGPARRQRRLVTGRQKRRS